MKLRLILAAATVATAFAGTAHADSFYNGNQLYEKCSAQTNSADDGFCYGYVSGVVDSVKAVGNCIGPRVPLDQVQDVVKKYLQSYPENRHYNASGLVAVAVKQAFCK